MKQQFKDVVFRSASYVVKCVPSVGQIFSVHLYVGGVRVVPSLLEKNKTNTLTYHDISAMCRYDW